MSMLNEKISINISEFYHLEWPQWLPHLKKYGFCSMETAINCIREAEQIHQLSELIKINDITVSAVHDWFHFFSPNNPEEIKWCQNRLITDLVYTRVLGSDKLIWYTGNNDLYEGAAAVDELLRRLEPVLIRAAEMKVTLLLETEFVGAGGHDPAASVQLLKKLFTMADTPYLACNFDPANLYVAGEEPFPYAYEELKPWIRYVHIKDVRELMAGITENDVKGNLQIGTKRCACCAAGDGGVNMSGLLSALKADHYDGYLSMELHMKEKYQDETLARSLDFIKQYWTERD